MQFTSRAWFIMLTASALLIAALALALSRYGQIKLGADDDLHLHDHVHHVPPTPAPADAMRIQQVLAALDRLRRSAGARAGARGNHPGP